MFTAFASLLALIAGGVNAYGNGVDTCESVPGHGTWAQGCNPSNCFPTGGGTALQPPYVIDVLEGTRVVNNYAPNTQYSIVLRPTNTSQGACSPTTCFRGFVINVGTGRINGNFAAVSASANITSGTLNLDPVDTNVRRMTSCNNGLTHNSNTNKRNARMIWVSPQAGSGPVTFKSVIVTSRTTANYVASMILNERPSPSASPSPIRTDNINANYYMTSDCSGTPTLTNVFIPQNSCVPNLSSSTGTIYKCDFSTITVASYSDPQCSSVPTNISYSSGSCMPGNLIMNCPAASATPSVTPNSTGTPSNSRTMRASRTPSTTGSNTASITASITVGVQPSLSSSISLSSSVTPSISVSNTQTGSNTQSVRPTPSSTDTPLETDTNTPSLTPNILPTTTSSRSNLPSYSSSPSLSPTGSASGTNSHTGSYTSEPSNSVGSSPSRTPLPSTSEIVSESATPSYSPTLGSSPSATETNNPDFITIITTAEQTQEQKLNSIGAGAAIGIMGTILIVGAFYVLHKRNMKRNRTSMRNVIIMRDTAPDHVISSHNPAFENHVQDAVPVNIPSRSTSVRRNSLEPNRARFEPVGIGANR